MTEKIIKGRSVQKHDTQAHWELAINFIPKQGELIIYDIDENYPYERIKIGDGVTNVNELPFAVQDYVDALLSNIPTIYVAETAPESASVGSIWVDTSVTTTTSAEEVSF